MKNQTMKQLASAVITAGVLWAAQGLAATQTERDAIEVLRSDLKADRKALIAEGMKLSDKESDKFWPIYGSYRAEAEKLTDKLAELILEYADLYPNVPEAKAGELLDKYMKLEAELRAVKTKYLKKFKKALPASKVFRFAQLDSRFELGIRMGLAAEIPILPQGSDASGGREH